MFSDHTYRQGDGIMNWLKRRILNLSIRQKVLSVGVIIIIIFSLIAFTGIKILTDEYNKTLYALTASALGSSAENIARELDTASQLSSLMLADNTIQSCLAAINSGDAEAARMNAYQNLNGSVNSYYGQFKQGNISFILLYTDKYTASSYSTEALPGEILEGVVQTARDRHGAPVWTTDYCYEYGLILAREIRKIENLSLDSLGVLIVCVDLKGLIGNMLSSDFENLFYLLYDNESLIYDNLPSKNSLPAGLPEEAFNTGYSMFRLDSGRYFSLKNSIGSFDWDYICLVSYDKIYDSMMTAILLFMGIVFLFVLLSTVVSSILVNYNNRILMKEAQLQALETQISPHFLYNTLESINWRSKAIGEKNIAVMTKALGDLFRITLTDFKEDFKLRQELEAVNCYITIQQLRFGSRLEFNRDIDEDLLGISVPKLIIQPLIENSIHHGLEENIDPCQISLTVKRGGGSIVITVKNSGSQFESDLLHKLEAGQIIPRKNGIGLMNIDKRLKLKFGSRYGLTLYNEGDWAVVRLKLPINKKDRRKGDIKC